MSKKKIIAIIVIIIVVLAVLLYLVNLFGTRFMAQSLTPGAFRGPDMFGRTSSTGNGQALTSAKLADYFNKNLMPWRDAQGTVFFTPEFKAAENNTYSDPVYLLGDWSGDGQNDAIVLIPFKNDDFVEMYFMTDDPKVFRETAGTYIAEGSTGLEATMAEMQRFVSSGEMTITCAGDPCTRRVYYDPKSNAVKTEEAQ